MGLVPTTSPSTARESRGGAALVYRGPGEAPPSTNEMTVSQPIWYIAYGSNLSAEHFASRLSEQTPAAGWEDEAWVWMPHELRFGGSSRTWDGSAVAFVSLRSRGRNTLGRAYLIDRQLLDDVLAAEHLQIAQTWEFDVLQLPISGWCPLPTRAKYNAILRLADVRGVPAFTITSSRSFATGRPADRYLEMCRQGLSEAGLTDVNAYLEAALARSLANEVTEVVPPRPSAAYSWMRELKPTEQSTGYPTVQLGSEDAWLEADGPLPGFVEWATKREPVWFLPPAIDAPVGASRPVIRALSIPDDGALCRLIVDYPTKLRRLPARTDYVEMADSIQVAPETASELGTWAVLVSPRLSGPVRLSPRPRMKIDAARVGYAARELWGLMGRHGDAFLVPIASVAPDGERGLSRVSDAIQRAISRVAQFALGAPGIPLRATEGVIGDEGHAVIRIDATALDFLGVKPGDDVVVSWAHRTTRARALLQTDELRVRMRAQLAETTGHQARLSTRPGGDHVGPILWHLQAWLSPSVRADLIIPPDTVVRVRRSIRHAFLRYLLALEVPVGGLIIAVLAIPGVPLWLKIAGPIAAFVIALIPLRVSRV